MFKYNFNDIFVGQIKQLLNSFNLPSFKILKDNEPIIVFKDVSYIYNNNIIKAKATKSFKNGFIYNDNDFIYIDAYDVDKDILNASHNLNISSNLYDNKTHLELGNYLRFQRDYWNLDLMTMYNCFSGDSAHNTYITDDETNPKFIFDTSNDSYKIYTVPIKMFKKYLISIDCATTIECVVGFYKDNNQLSKPNFGGENMVAGLYSGSYMKISGLSIDKPVVYDRFYNYTFDNTNVNQVNKWYNFEPTLTLFIKVPTTNTSSFVVLEYNTNNVDKYTNTLMSCNSFAPNSVSSHYRRLVTNKNFTDNYTQLCQSNYQLLINDQTQHPFANRLVEYLTKNAITQLDDYSLNVKRVETSLIDQGILGNYSLHSTFNNKLRFLIYLNSLNNGLLDRYYDELGYVDKDVEEQIIKFNDETSSLKGGL